MAQGRVVPDWEKVNTLRRVLVGLQAVGIDRVVGMPDASNLCRRSHEDAQVSLELEMLDMQVYHEEGDTVRAATMMREMNVDCLVTLGGDGTNRAAATGSGQIPIVAISTGTNNVFPTMVEGTLAGLGAGGAPVAPPWACAAARLQVWFSAPRLCARPRPGRRAGRSPSHRRGTRKGR